MTPRKKTFDKEFPSIKQIYGTFVDIAHIQATCLDKQRVRDVIERLKFVCVDGARIFKDGIVKGGEEREHILVDKLKKELGLEEQ